MSKTKTPVTELSQVDTTENVLAGAKRAKANKEAIKDLCDKSAYDIVWNKANRCYDLVTIKYSIEVNESYIEKVERSDTEQLIAIDKLSKVLDLKLLKER